MKIAFTGLLIFAMCYMAPAQQPFAPLGAQWYYSSQNAGIGVGNTTYWRYESLKDTVINNISCREIYASYYCDSSAPGAYCAYQSGTAAFVYQANDTVYWYDSAYHKFTLLYKFNVNPGDTITFYDPIKFIGPGADSLFSLVVDSVNFISISGVSLKQVYTSPAGSSNFGYFGLYAERLGCTQMMLPQALIGIPEGFDGPLRCYSDTAISVNFTSQPCDYHVSTGISQIGAPASSPSIYPNPSSGFINIQGLATGTGFTIETPDGRILNTGKLIPNQRVDISALPGGIYFITLSGEMLRTLKFVKD